ncbi:MAG: NDP-sugar synthase [Actinobacteria bacterium]|nr:NDP-sugar synthase [Actinomycetota bacterium]
MKAMILAAGLGTRLRPLTEEISKPMVPIVNKPVMEHIVELLATHKIKDVIANLHYYADAIKGHFGDGGKWGINLNYSFEETLMGTAGGVKKARNFFDSNAFIVLSGDALTDVNLSGLVSFHQERKALATIVLTEVEDSSKYGVVITDKEGRITEFQEKPTREEAKSNLANSGIYVFDPEIFKFIPENSFYDFGKNLFPLLLEKNERFYGFKHKDYWNDVGSLEEYQRGNFDALERRVKVKIPGTLIDGDIWIGDNCEIQAQVVLAGPICIGDNCLIKKNVKLLGPVIVGNNTVIDEGAVLYKGIKWGDGYIGKDASLIGGIIGYSTQIRDRASVLSDAVVGKGCVIGGGSIIHSSVKISSGRVIDINSEIKDNIF